MSKPQSFTRQRAAVKRIKDATWAYHNEVRRLDRDPTLYPEEKRTRLAEARAKAEAEVRAGKEAFAAGIAADRADHARYVDAPTGQELSQRLYWQQTAQAALAGLSGDAAAALISSLVQQGATAQAREYVLAARPVLSGLDYGRLNRATMPPAQKAAEASAAALDTYEATTVASGWLDEHVQHIMRTADTITEDERRGAVTPSQSFDDRRLDLMLDRGEAEAMQAFQAHVQYVETGAEAEAGGQS